MQHTEVSVFGNSEDKRVQFSTIAIGDFFTFPDATNVLLRKVTSLSYVDILGHGSHISERYIVIPVKKVTITYEV